MRMKRAIVAMIWAGFLAWCVVETCMEMVMGRSARDIMEDTL